MATPLGKVNVLKPQFQVTFELPQGTLHIMSLGKGSLTHVARHSLGIVRECGFGCHYQHHVWWWLLQISKIFNVHMYQNNGCVYNASMKEK